MNVVDRIYINYKKILCKILHKNCTEHIAYNTNTIGTWEHNDTPNYIKLKKSFVLKVLRKESTFVYSKRHKLQFLSSYRGAYFLRLGVAISRLLYMTVPGYLLKKTQQFTKMI